MQFTISSTAFSSHLQIASMALAKKSPMPILDGFLLEVKDGMITITASNSENSIITRVSLIDHQGEGIMCINAEKLLNSMKNTPEHPIVFKYNESSFELKGKYNTGEFKVEGMDAELFPPPISVTEGNEITIPSKELVAGVSSCLIATVEDEIMPFKRGIYFDIRQDSLIMVATDGCKLVKRSMEDVVPGIDGGFILPMRIAAILKGVVKKDSVARISFDLQRATITIDETTIYFRFVEARYPNYNSVIPVKPTIGVTLDRMSLLGAMKRIGAFCDHSKNLIKLVLNDNKATLSGRDIDYGKSAEEFVPCDYEGEPFTIGFSYIFFVEMLNSIKSDSVKLEFVAPERPCICKPVGVEDQEGLLMLLMPIKIESNM